MNAPWNLGGHPGRDPFGAYLCDDASLTVVREVATDLGWQAGRCNKGGLPAAVQSLSMLASPDILLVDLSESGDPLRDLDALAEVCEPGTTVLAVGQVNDVRLYRELLDRGIQDYLLKPVSADALHQAILQAQVAGLAPRSAEAGSVRRRNPGPMSACSPANSSTASRCIACRLSRSWVRAVARRRLCDRQRSRGRAPHGVENGAVHTPW